MFGQYNGSGRVVTKNKNKVNNVNIYSYFVHISYSRKNNKYDNYIIHSSYMGITSKEMVHKLELVITIK